jgi:hypothetical protein
MGLAKALIVKLFRQEATKFSLDGLVHSNVEQSNYPSLAVMKSVGGKYSWNCYWYVYVH